MPTDEENTEAIEEALIENALGPKRAKGDTGEVEQHSIQDLIALDKYRKSRQASQTGVGGRYFKFIPPGTA